MNPRELQIADFTYQLPEERIARYPLAERDASKLLIYKEGKITEDNYRNIAGYIPEGSLLVFNNTKVIEARLQFTKPTGGIIEIFCLSPDNQYADVTTAMLQKGKVWWNCLVGGASKWKRGSILEKKIIKKGAPITLSAAIIERLPDSFTVELSWDDPDLSFAEILHYAGSIPLPPYMKREAEQADTDRYQTVYAVQDGSVAAPTAGLHFSESIFRSLASRNIQWDFVTLHVGAGTFKPVKAFQMKDHVMHSEFLEVTTGSIEKLLAQNNPVFCVGTTSLRTVESLYWLGVKVLINPSIAAKNLKISQWEVYDMLLQYNIPAKEALNALLGWMKDHTMEKLYTQTELLIAPGYTPHIISGLITNFHQPQSTLLLLVAALVGDGWRNVYSYALKNDFRFLSYGDGCLFFTGVRGNQV